MASGNSPLIDDLGSGDGRIPRNDGRQGGWFVYNDGTGTQTPQPAPPNTCVQNTVAPVSNGQACTSGSGFTKWGAGIGVSLNVNFENCKSCNYDATVSNGVRFMINGDVPGGAVRFRANTADTVGVLWGGTCTDDTECTDSYGTSVAVTALLQPVQIPWTQLRQQGWGTKATFNLRQLFSFTWEATAGGGADFSICVDNLSFY